MNVEKIRRDFPILETKVNGHTLAYLDNAATTQKPRQVIRAIADYYEHYNANIHRAMHTLGEKATLAYEQAHEKVAGFIQAKNMREIVFTRNTTESLNLLAETLTIGFGKNDEVLLTEMEHHSNIVPWLIQSKRKGFRVKYIPIKENGELDLENLDKMITEKTKIVSFTHCSNVLGTINPAKEIIKAAHEKNALAIADAAQSVPHMEVNVKKINADFLAFSGHKMLGPTGIGVLYGREELLEKMPPFLGGGEMISEVWYDRFTPNELPWKFEAGTANIEGGIALSTAIEYLEKIGVEEIGNHEKSLTKYALNEMEKLKELKTYGNGKNRVGIISFTLGKIHAHDIATVLDSKGIAIRSGHHCAQPLMRKLGITGSARASFYLYNTREEIDRMIDSLKIVQKKLVR